MDIMSQVNYQIAIRFWQRNGDSSCVANGVNRQIAMFDDVSLGKPIGVPIILSISFFLNSVTKMWDLVIPLCMWMGRMGQANVLESQKHWLMTNELNMILPATIKSER